jgi:penicillin G amidase
MYNNNKKSIARFVAIKSVIMKRPILWRLVSLILIPALAVLVLARFYLSLSLPQSDYYEGEFKAYPKLSIQRDAQGVPLISANELEGIYHGLGVAHAQDRLWQMELLRRKAGGQLSEIYGVQKLHADKFARTMGFYQQARKDLMAMSDSTLAILNAYSEGVNYWLSHTEHLPLEFSVSSIKPQLWSALDSVAIFKVYAFELNASFHKDYAHLQLLQLFGSDYQNSLLTHDSEIDIDYSSQLAFTPLKIKSLALLAELQKDFNFGGAFTAIDGVVTSPQLLQQDQAHLAYTLFSATEASATPYYAKLNLESHKLAGVTLPGVPAVMFGENGSISWVGSPALTDTQDLIVEQFNPLNPGEYLYGNKWSAVEYRVEAIKVRANFPSFLRNPIQDVQLTVKSTSNGPLISDLLDTDLPISLVWTGFNGADTSYESILKLSHAENWSAFVEAAAGVVAPAMNFLYMDAKGNIGMQTSGKVPERSPDEGKLPIRLDRTTSRWTSFVTPQNMTSLFNPDKGWLTFGPGQSDLAARISVGKSDALPLNQLHSVLSEAGRYDGKTLLPLLLNLAPENKERETVLASLRDEMSEQQSAVSQIIYAAWLAHYRKLLVLDAFADNHILRISDQDASLWGAALPWDYLQQQLKATTSDCQGETLEAGIHCVSLVEQAFDNAIEEITQLAGQDISDWTLEKLQHGEFVHSIFGQINMFKSLVNQPIQRESPMTVLKPEFNQYQFGKGIITKQTPAMKVMHHGDKDISTSLLLLRGQSGDMFSPWHENQSPLVAEWVNR